MDAVCQMMNDCILYRWQNNTGILPLLQKQSVLVLDETQIFETMDPSIASEPFLLTDTPHSKIRKAGFPLDCISLDLKTGKYYYDMPKEELEQLAVEDGVLAFFEGVRSHGDRNVGF